MQNRNSNSDLRQEDQMFGTRNMQKQCFKTLSCLLQSNSCSIIKYVSYSFL